MNIYRIVGPPGTGKTTEIKRRIASACKTYPPGEVGAVSHTTAAVKQLVSRLIEDGTIGNDILKNTKTIHAHCFSLLSLDKEQVADKNLREWNQKFPQYMLKTTSVDEDQGRNDLIESNEEIWRIIQINRNRMISEAEWPTHVRDFWESWRNWCTEIGYVDFTGMLEQVLLIGRCPPVRVLFVDEVQDASCLQMEVILMWAQQMEVCCLVGDADQCIYRFAGADPKVFAGIDYRWGDVLSQSYRVPPTVHRKAMDILSQIRDRELIEYRPCLKNETGIFVNGEFIEKQSQVLYCDEPDFSLPGQHMIIARCNFRVEYWRRKLEAEYRIWCNPYKPDDMLLNVEKTSEFQALKTYLDLVRGAEVSEDRLKKMAIKIKAEGNIERGMKKVIEAKIVSDKKMMDIFDCALWGFTPEFLSWKKPIDEIISFKTKSGKYAKILADNDMLNQQAIILGTIHSVKGGEADNVWIDMKKTRKILQAEAESQETKDDELRIFYVAVTRSRNLVGIMK